ncbi:hypothetical protein DFQ28_000353 [Apophysomyces sp. BC1034]|nr:hypothetical protein DFQ30_000704 [Apophysomyces sp. BC1015]KAG0167902.1 hypothetical protein DFQ29_000206 [Apophysomyces sp. BC1021]KAG0183978.1 hypothetical protein DFQ28_000353 [Apophysomyces sp. BC1034]
MYYSSAQYEEYLYALYTVRYGLAYAVLSAVALLGALFLAVLKRPIWLNPYAIVSISALCYVISGAIIASMGNLQYYDGAQILNNVTSSVFFKDVFAPIAWLVVFVTYHITAPGEKGLLTKKTTPDETRRFNMKTASIYFGYLWFLILFVSEIGLVATLGQILEGMATYDVATNLYNTIGFVHCGLWVFIAPFAMQTWLSWEDIRKFRVSFFGYVFLLVLVNIGRSIRTSPAFGIAYARLNALHAEFVLARLCGILALYVAIIFGHRWTPKPKQGATEEPEEPEDKVEMQQEIPYQNPTGNINDNTSSSQSAVADDITAKANLAADSLTKACPVIPTGTVHANPEGYYPPHPGIDSHVVNINQQKSGPTVNLTLKPESLFSCTTCLENHEQVSCCVGCCCDGQDNH